MEITYNRLEHNLKVIEKYFNNYFSMGCAFMNGRGYGLSKGGFLNKRDKIGQITSYENAIEVHLWLPKYLKEIKKICKNIEQKEKIRILLNIKK